MQAVNPRAKTRTNSESDVPVHSRDQVGVMHILNKHLGSGNGVVTNRASQSNDQHHPTSVFPAWPRCHKVPRTMCCLRLLKRDGSDHHVMSVIYTCGLHWCDQRLGDQSSSLLLSLQKLRMSGYMSAIFPAPSSMGCIGRGYCSLIWDDRSSVCWQAFCSGPELAFCVALGVVRGHKEKLLPSTRQQRIPFWGYRKLQNRFAPPRKAATNEAQTRLTSTNSNQDSFRSVSVKWELWNDQEISRKLYSSLCTLRRGPSAATLAASASLAAWALWAMKFDWILPSLPSLDTPHITQNPRNWLNHLMFSSQIQECNISCYGLQCCISPALWSSWISWISFYRLDQLDQQKNVSCQLAQPARQSCQCMACNIWWTASRRAKFFGKAHEGTATVRNRETWLAALDAVKHGFQIYAPIHQHQLKGTEDGSNCCTNWV